MFLWVRARRRADASCAAEGHGGAADGADENAADAAASAVTLGAAGTVSSGVDGGLRRLMALALLLWH